MRPSHLALSVLPVLTACALVDLPGPSNLQPTYSATAGSPVITDVQRTGPVAPPYVHTDSLTIGGDGAWRAERVFTYADATPSTYVLGSGTLSAAQLQGLVDQAFSSPRFVDLPSSVDDRSVGGGSRTITLFVRNGSKSVTVAGSAPTAFQGFAEAIASATVDMSAVGPQQAGK